MRHGLEILVAALIALLAPTCAADDVPREILEIDEGFYRVTSGAYHSDVLGHGSGHRRDRHH